MTTRITPRDWEALSAYLDNQLNPKERSRIEARLQADPDLRRALLELRRTRQMLRSAPRLRAPRNFTLTPDMAGVRRGVRSTPNFYTALRLASLLATFFFVLVTAGSFAIQFASPTRTVVQRSEVQNAIPAPLGKGGGAGPALVTVPALGVEPTEAITPLQAQSNSLTPETQSLQVTPLANQLTAPTQVPMQALAAPRESTAADESPSEKQPVENALATPLAESRAVRNVWSLLGVVQIALALLALISGLATIYLRRNSLR